MDLEKDNMNETMIQDLPGRLQVHEQHLNALQKIIQSNQDYIKTHHERLAIIEETISFLDKKKK